jgi:hypothetical protein
MHSAAQEIAGRDVCLRGWPHIVSGKFDIEGWSLHNRHRLSRLEAEPRVKAEGAVMVGRLDESDARNIAGLKVIDCCLHKFATNPSVLRLGINRDRPNARRIDERWPRNCCRQFDRSLLPRSRRKPGLVSSIETTPVATSTDGKSRGRLWSSANKKLLMTSSENPVRR